jgi:predicted nucleic acid-binding protein
MAPASAPARAHAGVTRLLDSDVLIDYLRRVPAAVKHVHPLLVAGEAAASVATKTEILAGMREAEVARTLRLFGTLTIVPIDDAIATRAGALARHYRSSHPGIGLADYLIAATAVLVGAELWTQNPRHFPMFGGLEAPYER